MGHIQGNGSVGREDMGTQQTSGEGAGKSPMAESDWGASGSRKQLKKVGELGRLGAKTGTETAGERGK